MIFEGQIDRHFAVKRNFRDMREVSYFRINHVFRLTQQTNAQLNLLCELYYCVMHI